MWVVQYQRKEPQEFLMQWFGLLSVAYELRKAQEKSWRRDQNREKHSEECEKRCQVLDDV